MRPAFLGLAQIAAEPAGFAGAVAARALTRRAWHAPLSAPSQRRARLDASRSKAARATAVALIGAKGR